MNEKIAAYNSRREMDAERKKRKKREAMRVRPEFVGKAISEGRCRCCTLPKGLEAHHIVHRSKLRGMGSAVRDDLNNAMALCHECHMKYHAGKIKFRRSMLSTSELGFIIEHVGAGWLEKVYPERLNERLVRNRQQRNASPRSSFEAAAAASLLRLRTGSEEKGNDED